MTISLAEMPSLVTLVCAAAGRQVSATAPTARPNAFNDLDIDVSSLGPCCTKGEGHRSFVVYERVLSSDCALGIHRIDLSGIAPVHKIALQLHGRRQFLVLRGELAFDQVKLLDSLDAGEIAVDHF